MKPTVPPPDEQLARVSLDSTGVFNLLTDESFFDALEAGLPPYRERTYPPSEALAMFVAQVLSDDPSLRRAVDERIARALMHGMTPPSSSTSAFSDARRRLPMELVERLCKLVGRTVSDDAAASWRWRGRRTLLVDGTGFSMPDTCANQEVFPQSASQADGCGFPQGRLCALSCAATGAIVDATISAGKGKASGEQTQLRVLARSLVVDDVLVGDAINENYWTFALLQSIGCDGVFEINGGRCLARGRPRLITLPRPRRPAWMDRASYEASPESLVVRHSTSKKKGFRDKSLISTFTDVGAVSGTEIAALYARRWSVETDFLHLKCALGADVLRYTTPEMVKKELYVHLLAYNLIRLLMSRAAKAAGREPRTISFRHAVQLWSSIAMFGARPLGEAARAQLLVRLAQHKVGGRPGRCEPRAIKRRPKKRALLDLPREWARTVWFAYERH